ncbi:MAG TPA: UDP-N-acetylglucosamine 1-carboxyvinyltransferase [Candidatus Saccharimonadales bacterium]|nr:UDP-N-acetylglucosamine 1-carboxyvinyltransferase [Candidatus Saccharimonadales bacterium]
MESIIVRGGKKLSGEIKIQGSKNLFQKIIAACVRWPGEYELTNVPDILDAKWLMEQFVLVGGRLTKHAGVITLDSRHISPATISPKMTQRSRASFLFAGAFLGRFGEATLGLPGGDDIGDRPIDYHIEVFEALGIRATSLDKIIQLSLVNPATQQYRLPKPSIGATANALLAARSEFTLKNCAYDSDILAFLEFLRMLGSDIYFSRKDQSITISPAQSKNSISFDLHGDAHATATYALAAVLAGDQIKLTGINTSDTVPLWNYLERIGADFDLNAVEKNVIIRQSALKNDPVTVAGLTPPDFSTDWGPSVQLVMSQLPGGGTFHEEVFPNRFAHVPEFTKMGVRAQLKEVGSDKWIPAREWSARSIYDYCSIDGPASLHGASVRANDMRAGAALVTAGLIAQGETRITEAVHVSRGYEDMVAILSSLGADIRWEDARQ